MNDSWNVKSVRSSGQYQSCMKINGERLLPPVLSKECRKEMQYYKMLAQEVEKRISILKPYLTKDLSDPQSADNDATDTSEGADYEHIYDAPPQQISRILHQRTKSPERSLRTKDKGIECVKMKTDPHSKNLVIDLSLRIKHRETDDAIVDCSSVSSVSQASLQPIELPERDCNSQKTARTQQLENLLIKQLLKKDSGIKPTKELMLDLDTDICPRMDKIQAVNAKKELVKETFNFNFDLNKDSLSDAFLDIVRDDCPGSASIKSFTGSLLDIHSESVKEIELVPGLVRQSSYTVLKPSPELMAHLEIQSLNKGVAVTSISMSESVSNQNHKKRRSWDLEAAKLKWSSMALELNQTKIKGKSTAANANHETGNFKRNRVASPPRRSKSVTPTKKGLGFNNNKNLSKSDPIYKPNDGYSLKHAPSDRTITKEPVSLTLKAMIRDHSTPKPNYIPKTESATQNTKPVVGDSENPALKIRELYDQLKTQQMIQMNSLIEKQHKEQMFLQQVFEEQNNILFKQLKMICPKSPIEVRQAWGDKVENGDASGPVSLSQLNHIQTPLPSSPISKTLNDTRNYINHCDDVLKQSRDITNSLRKPQANKRPLSVNCSNKRSLSPVNKNGSRSPNIRNTSRKLNYESASDYEPVLTDRTNDTLADLNVTFPSDSEDSKCLNNHGTIESSNEVTLVRRSPAEIIMGDNTNEATKSLEKTIQNSANTMSAQHTSVNPNITPEKLAAASIIVAYAKGYLVRRLMETDRVQATVQTIRDALLCALQLHQDREGIRGADVDLHRRLIQQITAACYSLHDTFITTSPEERCALIAADRARRRAAAIKHTFKHTDVMSRSHSGVFPARSKRPSSAASLMTQSNYDNFSSGAARTRRRPWR